MEEENDGEGRDERSNGKEREMKKILKRGFTPIGFAPNTLSKERRRA